MRNNRGREERGGRREKEGEKVNSTEWREIERKDRKESERTKKTGQRESERKGNVLSG